MVCQGVSGRGMSGQGTEKEPSSKWTRLLPISKDNSTTKGGTHMPDNGIQAFQPSDGALSAGSYQTFELAKENDDVLGGDDIAQIRSYAAYARAQAQAIHKTIAATNGIEDVAAIKSEATETAQTFAKVSIYADQRIGEILRELPTRQGKRTDTSSTAIEEVTKAEALKDAGISTPTAYKLEQLAANPDVVQAVLDKAEADGRIPSRQQVLDAIHDRKVAEKERDNANNALAEAYRTSELMEAQIASLQKQVEDKPKPEVIEREVVREVKPKDYDSLRKDNERLNREYQEMWRKKQELDRQLEQANELLGEKSRTDNAQRDIESLTSATNAYLRQYGGKVWAFDQFDRVDKATQEEFEKAITSMAAFAQNIAQMIRDRK